MNSYVIWCVLCYRVHHIARINFYSKPISDLALIIFKKELPFKNKVRQFFHNKITLKIARF